MQIEDVFQQAVSTVQQPMIDEGSTKSDTDTRAYGSIEMEDNVEDILQKATSSAQPDVILEDSAVENLNSSQSQFEKSTPAAVGDHDMNVPSTTSEVGQEEYIEKCPGTSLNKQNKAKRQHEPRQKKAFSWRQSLADAGTSLEGGVRRSKRIKMRPLAYWKGKRFLYGCVHNSEYFLV
ncbi:unnamed protein product [Ilex paraguariensis]|uniref:Uncharacterized protein n=1 Tax=Ilex paraguariensis TaxID=185542 RepID=A0ABC8RH17_9AQUA